MKFLLTGDSHLGGIRQAQLAARAAPPAGYEDISIRPLGRGFLLRSQFFADRGDHAEIIEPEFRQRVERVPSADGTWDWIGISGPMNTARVWRDASWSRYKPIAQGGGIPVSKAMLKSIVEQDVRCSLDFVQVVSRSTRVFVIEPPWPFEAHRAVASNGAQTVQYLHRWYRDYVMAELERFRIPVLEVDPKSLDARGFTNPEFLNHKLGDRYHANARFGRLVLDRMLARFAISTEGAAASNAETLAPLAQRYPAQGPGRCAET